MQPFAFSQTYVLIAKYLDKSSEDFFENWTFQYLMSEKV